jgi:rhodanese-related sulfurtransferase
MHEQKIQTCFAIEDLQQLLKQSPDQLAIIDVRTAEEYTEKNIPGAINIPLDELERRSNELSKQSLIITVCGKGGGRSAEAAVILKQQGFSKALFLCEGTVGWYERVEEEKK